MYSLSFSAIKWMVCDLGEITTSASGAWPETMINQWVNIAIAQYEAARSQKPGGYTETRATYSTTASTTPLSTFPSNELVVLDSEAATVISAWLIEGSERTKLQLIDDYDRETSSRVTSGAVSGRPLFYEVIEAGGGLALRIWPPAASVYSLEVVSHNQPGQLSGGGDPWRYIPGTEDAVVCAVVMKILERNNQADTGQYQAIARRQMAAMQLAISQTVSRQRGVRSMRDTRSQVYSNRRGWR